MKKTTRAWDYGAELIEIATRKKYWLCRACHEKKSRATHLYNTTHSTTKWKLHLWHCSRIDIDGRHKAPSITTNSQTLDAHFSAKNSASTVPFIGLKPVDRMVELLLRLIVTLHLAYTLVENPYFRDLINLLNATLFPFLPKTAFSIRQSILNAFSGKKSVVSKMLRNSKSNIHLSFDMWTSDSTKSYLAVVGHFVDLDYNIRTILLAFGRVIGSHNGENMAHTLGQVVQDYEIVDNIGYFVLDNAESNDACIEIFIKNLHPQPPIPKVHRRLRCIGHIVNLAAQAFLYGNDPDAFFSGIMSATAVRSEQQAVDLWRRRGPIGKLHNVIKFIRRSSQRREEFLRIGSSDGIDFDSLDELMVVSDNATRWNSAFNMIDRALRLRERIDVFCNCHQRAIRQPRREDGDDGSVTNDTLTHDDWHTLTDICKILQIFLQATARLEGRASSGSYGAAWEVLPVIFYLLAETKQMRDKEGALCNPDLDYGTIDHTHIFRSLNVCISKLEKYKKLLSQSPIYVAANVMNPAYRWRWYQQNAPEDTLFKKEEVRHIWEDYYADKSHISPIPLRPSTATPKTSNERALADAFALREEPELQNDAYTDYCESPSLLHSPQMELEHSYRWWKDHTHMQVSKMAFDTLAVPAMSAECERVFSSAAHLITPIRSRLGDDTIEANECLKAWYNQKVGE